MLRDRRRHRGGGGAARWPSTSVRRHQGLSARLSHLHQRHHQLATGCARARHRSGIAAARRAQGLDGEAQDAAAARARRGQGRRLSAAHRQGQRRRPRQVSGADLASPRRRPLHRLRLDRDHARSRRRLDQCLDLPRSGARPRQGHRAIRPCRPARRHYRQEILGAGQALSARDRQWRGPGAVRRRL